MPRRLRRLIPFLIAAAIIAAVVYTLLPRPIPVDLAAVTRGPMQITVDEDGQTRIKERYIVSAPIGGRLSRITLDPGAPVLANQTVLATIEPGDPALLDPRQFAQAQARVHAADAALRQAEATLAAAAASLEQAQAETARQREMATRAAGRSRELEDAIAAEAIRAAEHRAAGFAVEIARFELQQARAALLFSTPDEPGAAPSTDTRFPIRAPVSGRILRVFQESSAVVAPGAPLVEVGDPTDLEAQIDVLSSQAVAIRPGDPVLFEQWGGDAPLRGLVRLVEPSAFTKISALGVEEQRVYVIIDFTDPPEARASLGDGFRVEAHIIVWSDPAVLQVPSGALFRHAGSWAVYTAQGRRARLRDISVGRRNATEAQILDGLAEGELVIAYPSDQIRPGVAITPRK